MTQKIFSERVRCSARRVGTVPTRTATDHSAAEYSVIEELPAREVCNPRRVGTKFVPTLRSFSHTRHSGESWNPERTGMRSILNFDPSDRVYILDSGVRRNDDVGVETGVRDATVLNALLRVQYCTGAVTHKFRTIIKQIGSLPCAPFARGKESNCGIFFMYRNLGVAALALHANEVIE